MNYEVITIEDLKNYLESSHYMMDIKLLSHCKRLGIVKSVKGANTGFMFDRLLTLSNDEEVVVWI